jgi:hypothetical protein
VAGKTLSSAFQKPRAPSSTALSGAILSPRLFAAGLRQRALAHGDLEANKSYLPSGVASIAPACIRRVAMRAYRKTPSDHTHTYRRAERSRFRKCSYSPSHSAVSLQITGGERFGAFLPRSANQRLLEVAHCSSFVRIFLLTGFCISIYLFIVMGLVSAYRAD